MSSPETIIKVLRARMRAAKVSYQELGSRLGLSESSVKRVFSHKDMSLTRLAAVCKAINVPMDEVLRDAADAVPLLDELTLEQEKTILADPRTLLVAVCCLGHWQMAQILDTYNLSQADCVRSLAVLDRVGLITLRPDNSYKLRVSQAFRWRPGGPAQAYLQAHVVGDFFGGDFAGSDAVVLCVPSRLTSRAADEFVTRVQTLAADLARMHEQERTRPAEARDGYTLLVGFRSWEFKAFTAFRRKPAAVDRSSRTK